MIITSLENPKVVSLCKLADKKQRKNTGLYVIEGERLVCDAIKYGAEIVDIFVKESAASKFHFENQIVLADKIFAKLSETVTSQGVLATVMQSQENLCAPEGCSLVLDGLQDPGNVGTLIRTAVACGFTDIYAVNTVDVYSPKVLRSAMSAHFCVKLHQTNNLQQVFDVLQGVQIVAADMGGTNLFTAKLADKVAVVLGNEGNGLSQLSRASANITVALPMQNGFESLNVAVAGSVIMYQIYGTKQGE